MSSAVCVPSRVEDLVGTTGRRMRVTRSELAMRLAHHDGLGDRPAVVRRKTQRLQPSLALLPESLPVLAGKVSRSSAVDLTRKHARQPALGRPFDPHSLGVDVARVDAVLVLRVRLGAGSLGGYDRRGTNDGGESYGKRDDSDGPPVSGRPRTNGDLAGPEGPFRESGSGRVAKSYDTQQTGNVVTFGSGSHTEGSGGTAPVGPEGPAGGLEGV